jgi:hypothetical protein
LDGDEEQALAVQHVNSSPSWLGIGRTHAVVFTPDFVVEPGRYRIRVASAADELTYEWTTTLITCSP